ncbi:hypothetical protein N7481_003840 [Penicillium waksmanii]|uniref:uncharacterized protein n=1 Tax=Penicillium waksmanii TaxID=69791 RepID=UPI0025478E09|nr:uncharacterized protein N7481_003840 [Penicillium waksmanii]KAJ5988630.1 hypothetical protein N7481_003840 [Penicillium waksmanii]
MLTPLLQLQQLFLHYPTVLHNVLEHRLNYSSRDYFLRGLLLFIQRGELGAKRISFIRQCGIFGMDGSVGVSQLTLRLDYHAVGCGGIAAGEELVGSGGAGG